MRNRRKLTIVLATAASLLAGPAMAMCLDNSERQAITTRVLQTELMVAALTCGQQGEFNTFARKFEGELVSQGKLLRAAFQRNYGGQGEPRLNALVTRLANEASQRSISGRAEFCPRSAELFDVVLNTPPAALSSLAEQQPFSSAHGVSECSKEVASQAPAAQTSPVKAQPR